MFIGHIGAFIYNDMVELRLIGRFGFPIFLFLVGYSLKYKNQLDLIILAVAISIFDGFIKYPLLPLNILYTVIFTRIILNYLDKKGYLEKYLLQIMLLLIIWWLPTKLLTDYGTGAMMFAICGYLVRNGKKDSKSNIFFVLSILFYTSTQPLLYTFNAVNLSIFVLLTAFMGAFFYKYSFKKHTSSNKVISLTLFISRNSMLFYFLQLIIFKLVNSNLYPENYEYFKLF